MIQFNFQKTSQVPKSFYRKRKEVSDYLKKIRKVVKEKDYSEPESFLALPEEKFQFPKSAKKPKLIIVVGIGGSSLGAEAIFEALKQKKKLAPILFLDAINPLFLKSLLERVEEIQPEKGEVLICLISKTGKTFETLVNFFVLSKKLQKYQPEVAVITNKNSPLWQFAKKQNCKALGIPWLVGGRYSVFSNVGVFPLTAAGLNTKELLRGAREANRVCLVNDPLKNPAFSGALTIFYNWKIKKRNIYSNLVFPPDLESFGKWYVQLVGESLGKDKKGVTPTVTVGTTDFHAIGQLYFDGPRDKLINFVFLKDLGLDFQIPKDKNLASLFQASQGRKLWQVNFAIFQGVKRAYLKKKLPFTETIIPELSEKYLGFLLETRMIEAIILGKLMGVNAFDQPGVDLYKKETKKILAK